jgi:ankyrin repeat protein
MSDLGALIQSATQGDREKVQAILDADPALANQLDESGATALHYAALNGHRDVVRLLVQRGAAINRADAQFGATPTGWAIEYLREIGGFLGIELADLAYAIEARDTRWVARFLERFPGLRQASAADGRPFRQLAAESGSKEIAALFEAADAG